MREQVHTTFACSPCGLIVTEPDHDKDGIPVCPDCGGRVSSSTMIYCAMCDDWHVVTWDCPSRKVEQE